MRHDLLRIAAHILFDAFQDSAGSRPDARQVLRDMPDRELVLLCQAELPYETSAYEVLINRYRNKAYGKIVSMLKHSDEAQDVLQDVLVKVFHGLPRFKMKSSFSTWLYTITVNTCLNHIEKLRRRPLWWISADVNNVNQEQLEDESTFLMVDQGLEKAELRQSIERTIAKLSGNASEVLRMRYFEELDYNTISERLGIGLSATKMRLKRAREEFRNQFDQQIER